ncbi:unnamed protein product [Caretta caretta]
MLEVLHLSRMDGIYVGLMRMMRATMREMSADCPIDSFLSSFMFINQIWASVLGRNRTDDGSQNISFGALGGTGVLKKEGAL